MMREMKNSGVRWIGDIPSNWKLVKFKHVAVLYTGDSISDSEKDKYEDNVDAIPYIPTKALDSIYKTIDYENGMYVKHDDFSFRRAHKDDVLMCVEGGSAGKKKALLDKEVAFGNKLCCFHTFDKVIGKYIFYLLCSVGFEDEFIGKIQGLIGGVSVNSLKNFFITQPPLNEQKAIADFLDAKCVEIDGLLSDLDAEVKTLAEYKKSLIAETVTRGLNPNVPMKSSGIPWADTIPAHWKVEKFRYKLKPKKIVGQGDKEVLSVYREYGVVIKNSRDDNHNRTSEDTSNYKYVQPNDFVINKMKAWQGSMGVSDYEGIVSPAYFVYSFCDEDYLPKFFHYYMRNANNIPEYRRLSGGIREGQWDLSPYDLGNMPIIVPQMEEQVAIADFLDTKCAAIDQAITDKTTQIETLKAYKASLIYEYVTGKKQVAL